MGKNNEENNILLFKRSVESYMRLSRQAMEEGDLIEALSLLRQGEQAHPQDWQSFWIAKANVLNRMQRYDQSLRLLLTVSAPEELPEDGVFGITSNFLAMEEFAAAHAWLEMYLAKWPEGDYAETCRNTLSMLHSGEEFCWQLGLEEGEDPELIAHIHYAKSMHFSMHDDQSLAYLQDIEKKYPTSLWLQMEIALNQFCVGEYAGAEQRVFNILKRDKDYVRARCLLVLLRLNEGKKREAREMMDAIAIPLEGSMEELGNVCTMLLEVEDYKRAEECAGLMLEQMPYDLLSLHEMAYAKVMLGKQEEAYSLYETIEEIDPEDTVVDYYLSLVQLYGMDKKTLKKEYTTIYDVSYGEALQRFNEIKRYLKMDPEKVEKAWETDRMFQRNIRWALYSPLFQVKKPLFSFLGAMGDVRAHDILTDFLLRMDESDQDKQMAIAALKIMGDEGPFNLYFEGVWRYGMVKALTLPEDLPRSYHALFEELTGLEKYYDLPEGVEDVARRLFYHYVQALQGDYPRMDREQRWAMLAALAIMAQHIVSEEEVDAEDMANRFGVSLRRLHNALNRLLKAVQTNNEDGEEDPE